MAYPFKAYTIVEIYVFALKANVHIHIKEAAERCCLDQQMVHRVEGIYVHYRAHLITTSQQQ